MLRTFTIALFSVTLMAAACKSDKPASTAGATKPAETTKPADPAKPADPPAKPADPAAAPAAPAAAGGNTELQDKGIAMMQSMADVFASDAKDCEKLAVDMKAFITKNKELLTQLMAMEKKMTDAEKSAFEARNKTTQAAMMEKMTPAMNACRDNKSLEAAMKEFPTD
ncbi:MAG TPA: hypothetical protein VFT22_17135 [Kofleriaceae bacterium]|nr:hypothetical protein [Kofleriaceae bacterium]